MVISGNARNRLTAIMFNVSWKHFGSLNSDLRIMQKRGAPPHGFRRVHQLEERVALHVARLHLVLVRKVEANAADQQLPPKEGTTLRSERIYAVSFRAIHAPFSRGREIRICFSSGVPE